MQTNEPAYTFTELVAVINELSQALETQLAQVSELYNNGDNCPMCGEEYDIEKWDDISTPSLEVPCTNDDCDNVKASNLLARIAGPMLITNVAVDQGYYQGIDFKKIICYNRVTKGK